MSDAEDKSMPRDTEGEIPLETIRHPETMYDRSDLSARGIIFFLVALAVTLGVTLLVLWGFFRVYARQQLKPVPRNAAIVTPSRLASPKGDPVQRFPAPQLQPDPVADLNKFRIALEQQLNSAGPGRIPIEQAIDAISKNGLPVRPPPVLPPRAIFGSGDGSPAGSGGGTEPKGNQ
jgi:hypothetical protein